MPGKAQVMKVIQKPSQSRRMGFDPQGQTILQRRRDALLENFFVPADTARHIQPDAGRPELPKNPLRR